MLDMRHVCITLKLYWIRYYTRKALENRAMREVPTLAAVRSRFQSLTSLYIVIPLQGRNTAWYPQLGQALKNIYLGYFRAIWNNSELVYTHQHVLIGMWGGQVLEEFFFPGRWKERVFSVQSQRILVVDITYIVLQSGLLQRSRRRIAMIIIFLILICVNSKYKSHNEAFWWENGELCQIQIRFLLAAMYFLKFKWQCFVQGEVFNFLSDLSDLHTKDLWQKNPLKCWYSYWFKKTCVCTLHFRRSTSLKICI